MKKPVRTSLNAKPKHTAYSQRLALESRLVFDGAALATVDVVQPDVVDANPVIDNALVDATLGNEPNAVAPDQATIAVDFQPNTDNPPTYDPAPMPLDPLPVSISPIMDVKGDKAATSVIVVDQRADNAAALLTNPPANTQILTLDTTRDGFQQVADYLQTRHGVTQLDVLTWSDANYQQWLGNKALTAPVAQRSEIVFIESNVTDYQTLLNSINPNVDVYILDSSKDGLAQMAHILNGRSGIDAIHIVSHGSTASVGLGSLILTAQNLSEHNVDLAAIGRTLNQSADILWYGCNVGAGSDGTAFIASLAQFTQPDIAASIDVTGTADKNGNWVLEARSGTIDSSIAFTDTVTADYHDVLGLVNGGATGNSHLGYGCY